MITIHHCMRCDKDWTSRKPEPPRRCGVCGALYWDRPKRIPKHYGEPGKVGAPLKFPELATLIPGGRVLLKWRLTEKGEPDFKTNATLSRSAFRKASREGWKVRIEPKPEGLWVIRMA